MNGAGRQYMESITEISLDGWLTQRAPRSQGWWEPRSENVGPQHVKIQVVLRPLKLTGAFDLISMKTVTLSHLRN